MKFSFSYVLVCVSIDRLYAIVRPMDVRTASSGREGRDLGVDCEVFSFCSISILLDHR